LGKGVSRKGMLRRKCGDLGRISGCARGGHDRGAGDLMSEVVKKGLATEERDAPNVPEAVI